MTKAFLLQHVQYQIEYILLKKENNRYYFWLMKRDNDWKIDDEGTLQAGDLANWKVFKEAGWSKKELSQDKMFEFALAVAL